MASTLLGIARGAASGFAKRKQDAEAKRIRTREEDRQDLATAIELGNQEGITLEDPTPDPVTPAAPVIPGLPGSAQSHSAIMQAAHDSFKTTMPGAEKPAAPAAPAAPRNVLEIGRASIGGKTKRVMLDPTQTAGGKRKAAETANRSAFDRLNADGTAGAYEPTFDYRAKERTDIEEKSTIASLIAAGVDPEEAKLLAKHKIDVDLRRERAERLAELKRHNKVVEGYPRGGARGATTPKQELASVNTQISATRQDLNSAKKGALPDSTTSTLYNLDPQAYRDSSANVKSRVRTLENRADSLRTVGDSLSAIVQGKNKTAPASTGSGKKVKLSAGTTVTDADLDAALEANGNDVKKARAWLTAQGKK